MNFEKNFVGKEISWEGYYTQVKINTDPQYLFYEWIYVKMEPTESQAEFPDLILGVPRTQTFTVKAQLAQMKRGQLIKFVGEFISMGDDFHYHVLKLMGLDVEHELKQLDLINEFLLEGEEDWNDEGEESVSEDIDEDMEILTYVSKQ